MTELLLAEELFLLAHDDESGKAILGVDSYAGYAGALLMDLATAQAITLKGEDVVAAEAPADLPLLERARAVIAGSDTPRPAKHWVRVLPTTIKKLDELVGSSLVERGVLGEEHGKSLGIFARTTWPERDPEPERRLRERLTATLVDDAQPDARTAALVALLHGMGVVRNVVDKSARKHAQQRAKEIATAQIEHAEVSDAVADAVQAVQAVQAAVMVAVIVPTIVSTT